MNRRASFYLLVVCAALAPTLCLAQTLPNPILFVTHVPTPLDSATVAATFGNHVPDMPGAPRGGDLWIRYTDGTLRNLTAAAGYGVSGAQGAGAIDVREPAVHWNGTKAVFSMVVGGASSQGDTTTFRWQLYEITSFGQGQTPVIARVANQPPYNNVSPIYGTDDRIIFTSDRPINGAPHLYPAVDEYKGAPSNTGLWSLDPANGDVLLLDASPSGDFSPTIDSYGRLLVMRWDRLQRDRNADIDALGPGAKGAFDYTNESPSGVPQFGVRNESFPEPQGSRTDLLAGTNMVGFEFNQFFPWQLNEDGSSMEIINHIGRHDFRPAVGRAINDDSNVVNFVAATSQRSNRNPLGNLMQVREDPTTPGLYYGIDAVQSGTHGGGQVVTLTAQPTLDPDQSRVGYYTDRSTQSPVNGSGTPPANHSGFYRNPTPLGNGSIIVSHSPDPHPDRNTGTRAAPGSIYTWRLKTMRQSGNAWVADQTLTSGITKSVTYWDPDVQVSWSGTMWEMDPVEVRVRQRPTRRYWEVPAVEKAMMADEGVDEAGLRLWLRDSNLALTVTRDVTHRDGADRQQPYFLRVTGTTKQSPGAHGKVYDVSQMQFYQGDYIRGSGLVSQNSTPHRGRRILAVPMHLPTGTNPNSSGPTGSVGIASDGSLAAFLPAHRPVTWQLLGATGTPTVRERYWVTFQPGEIRVCASCHGTNDAATNPLNPIPQNPPEALRSLLRTWKTTALPAHISLTQPANDTTGTAVQGVLRWFTETRSANYQVQLSTNSDFATTVLDQSGVAGVTASFTGLDSNRTYFWRVRGTGRYGTGDWSTVWKFTTAAPAAPQAPLAPALLSPTNDSVGVPRARDLRWQAAPGATEYRVQLASSADFGTLVFDTSDLALPRALFSGLAASTRYYWRVEAKNGVGASPWSETWSFTTTAEEPPPAPVAPLLVSPANDSTDVPRARDLRWSDVAGATEYRVQLSLAPDFATTVLDAANLQATSAAFGTLEWNTRYYWRVNASNGGGTGPWSPTWSFTTVEQPQVSVESGVAGEALALHLEQNHPDPFGETTVAAFILPRAGRARLSLYSLNGTRVAVLFDAPMEPGNHTQTLDASRPEIAPLPDGVYALRLETADGAREILIHLLR